MKLGEIVKQRREESGLSLQGLADAVGLTKSHLWDIERGKTVNIGLLTAVRLSIALAVPVNALAASAIESTVTAYVVPVVPDGGKEATS